MTKEKLREYYWIRRNIAKLESRLIQLDSESTKVTTQLKKDPIMGQGNTSDKVGNAVVDMELVREELSEQIKGSYAMLTEIERAIEVLPARERYLIRARYVELLSWEQIAVDMNYSWQWVHKIHSNALEMLA